ncbi:MAG: hypothetical protein NXI19_09175 [Alphaproteobacteria bacterium]|nr:hypothetical protein [Alphaproteobacteria bacterium]
MADKLVQHFLVTEGDVTRTGITTGRDAWALQNLVSAGADGCTPIDTPGPRWSAYVHALRHEHGLSIETLHEAHGGPYAGTHARYVLRSKVRLLPDAEAA